MVFCYSRVSENVNNMRTNYNPSFSGLKNISSLLPKILGEIDDTYSKQPGRILKAWPEIIGPRLASMTEASFLKKGVLLVKVKNSALYSLLQQHEKKRLLNALQEKFSKEAVCNIVFRLG